MDCTITNACSFTSFPSSSLPSQSPSYTPAVAGPCAACKVLRRKCTENCILAPYFPPNEPMRFVAAHRVFSACNIIKSLQELPEDQRVNAVNSMVYEANARIRDPVHGCAGVIYHLMQQINVLQAQLAKAQVEIVNMQSQMKAQAELVINMESQEENSDNLLEMPQCQLITPLIQPAYGSSISNTPSFQNDTSFFDDKTVPSIWEPGW